MKLLNKKRFILKYSSRVAGLFIFCAVLTGCTNREAEFFAEELQEEAAETEASKKTDETDAAQEALQGEGHGSPKDPEVEEAVQEPAEIYVDICGAVVNPGVFKLEEGSRAFQAIEAAGGYLPEAVGEYINGAGILSDGQQIYVPTEDEIEEAAFPDAGGAERSTAEGIDTSNGKVNLNTADEAGLMTLTGIGATRAQAIISYREENGPFTSIEEIMNVQGIKEGTFTKIKEKIEVG